MKSLHFERLAQDLVDCLGAHTTIGLVTADPIPNFGDLFLAWRPSKGRRSRHVRPDHP